jgi:type II secretion system protein J
MKASFRVSSSELQRREGKQSSGDSRWRAFTLIEIMIAITIFGVVLIAIYSSWSAILRGSKIGLDAAAEAQRSRMALRALEESLASVQLFTANIKHYSFLADTSSDFAELSFVARLPASFPGSGLFGEQAVRRVNFSVDSVGGQNRLVLRQSALLEANDANAQPYSIVLAPNVSRFQMEFLDTNKLEWLPEWTFTNRLPKVVRIALGFGQKGRARALPEDVAIQTVFVSSLAIPRELQIPAGRRIGAPLQTGLQGEMPPTGPRQAPQPAPGALNNPRVR